MSPDSLGLHNPFSLSIFRWVFIALQSHGVRNKKFPEAERIYREKVVFLPSGVGGVVAVEEEAAVLVDDWSSKL